MAQKRELTPITRALTERKPIGSRNTAGRITEDDPRWNPFTMGNNMQGPHGTRRNYTPSARRK